MSFIWGLNTGEQLVKLVTKIPVCAVAFKGFVMQIYFELQNFKKMHSKVFVQPSLVHCQPPIQSSKISKDNAL